MINKTTKKPPRKRITKKKSINFKIFTLTNLLVAITIIALTTTTYFYIQTENLKKENLIKDKRLKEIKKENQLYEDQKAKYFEEKTNALDIEYSAQIENNTYLEEQIKDEDKNGFVFDDLKKTYKQPKEIIKEQSTKEIGQKKEKNLPKLAIIIDDVTTQKQMNNILDIGYNVNMAFLPPTPRHRNSAKIAQALDTYMIHLPLQASSNKYDEKNTLYVNSTYETIEERIRTLQSLYPKAKFINNHTGSKFTSNQEAMDRLFKVLRKYDYTFVDSRTTAKSVAADSSKKYGVRLLSRNIFLDNTKDKKYIQNQLKKAIKIAKKHGSAIAIGHPYEITFQTLKDSKDLLLGLELVYVNQL